jgi:hypothetical protein
MPAITSLLVSLLFCAALVSAPGLASTAPPATLAGLDLRTGQQASLALSPSLKARVIVFLSTRCPCSQSHEAKLRSAVREFPNVQFVGVHSNMDEPLAEARSFFEKEDLPFPVIQDTKAHLADALGALKTPHVFIYDPRGKRLFSGGIDETHHGELAKKNYLRDALLSVEAGKSPDPSEVRTLGCFISRSSNE